jgi:hypothetical protein
MNITSGLLVLAMVGLSGCASWGRHSSADASQKLLLNDQRDIEKREARYKDAVLKHGESSDEAVEAKTEWDNAKNKLAADQIHVQQLQNIEARQNGGTTTTTTVTTTPAQPK